MLTVEELLNIGEGSKSVALKVIDRELIFDESYAENGMIAVFSGFKIDSDGLAEIFLDWDRFKEINIPLEVSDFFINKDGKESTGTMKEAGLYPENGIEKIYFDLHSDSGFELYESDTVTKAIKMWKDSNSDKSFVEWMAEKIVK